MASFKIEDFRIDGSTNFRIHDFDTTDTGDYKNKQEARKQLTKNIRQMADLQERFYAQDREALLILFQAMDSAGKDSAIKHVMSGLNPQGVQVASFKQPSFEELDHDYLWRINKALPARGNIGIFNRSYYEEVLVSKVHDLPYGQKLPARCLNGDLWQRRYQQLGAYENYLYENGTTIIKFFLHISKEEQKKRFLDRIDNQSKNWKFSAADITERGYWEEYMDAYEQAINATADKHAPWYIIPADKKWFARLLISEIIIHHLDKLNPVYPTVSKEQLQELAGCRKKLMDE
jgi:PPK2 family polyphosphate:nucleotide phosphotransferase